MSEPLLVAVDGPGGSGKSTVSRRLGEVLGLPHLDTGTFYRAATLAVLRAGVDPADASQVVRVAADAQLAYRAGSMFLDGVDVTSEIRSAPVTEAVSAVSAIPELRVLMVAAQRAWVAAVGGSAVVEGRDIGTVVFPGATVKVFLTADPEVRAARRAAELDTEVRLSEVAADLDRRDHFDASREASPLQIATDAVRIDTTDLVVEEVVAQIAALVAAAGPT